MTESNEPQAPHVDASPVIAGELPGMPDGDVPSGIRMDAETLILLEAQKKDITEQINGLKEKLMLDMARGGTPVVVIILNGRKHRISYSGSIPKITIKAEGISVGEYGGEKKEVID